MVRAGWWWRVMDSNHRRLSRRFYRPLPLAARATRLRRSGYGVDAPRPADGTGHRVSARPALDTRQRRREPDGRRRALTRRDAQHEAAGPIRPHPALPPPAALASA